MHEVLGVIAVEDLERLEEPAHITSPQPHVFHSHTMSHLVISYIARFSPTEALDVIGHIFLVERHCSLSSVWYIYQHTKSLYSCGYDCNVLPKVFVKILSFLLTMIRTDDVYCLMLSTLRIEEGRHHVWS